MQLLTLTTQLSSLLTATASCWNALKTVTADREPERRPLCRV